MLNQTPSNSERALVISVITTTLSLIPTAYVAIIANSVVLYGDFLRCAVECCAIILSWIIVRRVNRADRSQFHYGVGKLEQLSGASVGLALLIASFVIGGAAVYRGLNPQPLQNGEMGLLLSFFSVAGNLGMTWHYTRLSRTAPSPVLASQAQLFLAKTLVSLVVAIALGIGVFLPDTTLALIADPVGSAILAIFLARSSYRLVSASMKDLIDCSVDEAMQLAVLRVLIEKEELYVGMREIRTRRAGRTVYLEILLEFAPTLQMQDVRLRVEALTASVRTSLPDADVLVIPV